MDIDKEILSYDINYIHSACEIIGHSTNWEFFEDELKTYSLKDKQNLLDELKFNDSICEVCGNLEVNCKCEVEE